VLLAAIPAAGPARGAGLQSSGTAPASLSIGSPLFSKRHLAYAAVGGAATWVALQYENANAAADAIHGSALDPGADIGNQYARASILAAGTAALWTAGKLAGSDNVAGAAQDLATGLLIDGAAVFAIKSAVDRTRPNGEHWSFPSGHTASAFTAAPILASRFGWKVGLPAYALAVSTGLGRIEDHWHFPSDVIAGATLGLIVGESVVHRSSRLALPEHLYVGREGLGFKTRF
jgi:membrane-associated phospholipid phosphatase